MQRNKIAELANNLRASPKLDTIPDEIMDMTPDCDAIHDEGLGLVQVAAQIGYFNETETQTALETFGPDCADMVNHGYAPGADKASIFAVHELLVPIAQALNSHGG